MKIVSASLSKTATHQGPLLWHSLSMTVGPVDMYLCERKQSFQKMNKLELWVIASTLGIEVFCGSNYCRCFKNSCSCCLKFRDQFLKVVSLAVCLADLTEMHSYHSWRKLFSKTINSGRQTTIFLFVSASCHAMDQQWAYPMGLS